MVSDPGPDPNRPRGDLRLEDQVGFTNEFRVPADVDTTFATLIDLEKVAPCLPGATIESADGGDYAGQVKVKIGPIRVVYRGTARLTNVDEAAKTASISARGKETRGTGTASADVATSLRREAGGTVVTVVSSIDVTGRPAQFGQAVLADVAEQIVGQFASRLEALLDGDGSSGSVDGTGTSSSTKVAAPGPGANVWTDAAEERDGLDLVRLVGPVALRRLAPAVAVIALLAIAWRLMAR